MNTIKHTSKAIKKLASKTDYERLDAMTDDAIDYSDLPELTADDFKQIIQAAKSNTDKVKITVRLDADVLSWLKEQGGHYQRRLNRILRSVMQSS